MINKKYIVKSLIFLKYKFFKIFNNNILIFFKKYYYYYFLISLDGLNKYFLFN